jgi:hypothetical protein
MEPAVDRTDDLLIEIKNHRCGLRGLYFANPFEKCAGSLSPQL